MLVFAYKCDYSICMMNTDKIIDRVKAFAANENLNKSQLAALAGIGDTTLRNLDKPNWNPTVKILRKLEAVIPSDFEG